MRGIYVPPRRTSRRSHASSRRIDETANTGVRSIQPPLRWPGRSRRHALHRRVQAEAGRSDQLPTADNSTKMVLLMNFRLGLIEGGGTLRVVPLTFVAQRASAGICHG